MAEQLTPTSGRTRETTVADWRLLHKLAATAAMVGVARMPVQLVVYIA